MTDTPAPQSTPDFGVRTKKTARMLGGMGLIPMLGLAALAVWGGPSWARLALVSYAMLILAFMAGTLWARRIYAPPQPDSGRFELLASNALVLAAWPAIGMSTAVAAVWLGSLFALHLGLDQPWRRRSGPAWYRHMRLWISVAVIGSLLTGGAIGLGMNVWSTTP